MYPIPRNISIVTKSKLLNCPVLGYSTQSFQKHKPTWKTAKSANRGHPPPFCKYMDVIFRCLFPLEVRDKYPYVCSSLDGSSVPFTTKAAAAAACSSLPYPLSALFWIHRLVLRLLLPPPPMQSNTKSHSGISLSLSTGQSAKFTVSWN